MKPQKLPIGIQSFVSLRNDGYLYVDKTALMYQLVNEGKYYFLSRPRRFGKSLLISTLHAYFDGKKELFEGLAVSELEKDWAAHPVLHLDLNTEKYDTAEALTNKIDNALCEWEKIYGKSSSEKSFPIRFEGIIKRACEKTGQRVAILVDEYDKPMLQAIGNEDLQDEYRKTLKGFYGALKSMDEYIQFAILTGVTKFSKVSIFSDLNNLKDISFDPRYQAICGMTEEEVRTLFAPHIAALAEAQNASVSEAYDTLKTRYDGYHFAANGTGIYNPFSLLSCLDRKEFGNYWFETGTPTFLVELLKKQEYNLYRMAHEQVTADTLNSIDAVFSSPIPVMYQSGYLTIKDYDNRFGIYTLGFPNTEVRDGFMRYLRKKV